MKKTAKKKTTKRYTKKRKPIKTADPLDLIHLWLDQGIDIDQRRIDLSGPIGEKSFASVKRSVAKMVEIGGNAPIHVFVNTYGGGVYESIGIYDVLKGCGCDVYTYAHGKVMSGGMIVFAAGAKRFSLPNTTFMAHSASYEANYQNIDHHEIDVRETRRINNVMADILSLSSNKNASFWRKKLRFADSYLTYDDAVKLGIITEPL